MDNLSLAAKMEHWTREALTQWGEDWRRISEHIERRLAALSADERRALTREAQLTLAEAPSHMLN